MTDIMQKRISRRNLLRVGGCTGVVLVAGGATGVLLDSQTDIIDRIRGISQTSLLDDPGAWEYADQMLVVALDKAPELAEAGSAVRLEDDQLPEPLLIVHGTDDEFYVFVNKCSHGGRKIDMVDGQLKCCSLSGSEFAYSGKVESGTAPDPLTTYEVIVDGSELTIRLA